MAASGFIKSSEPSRSLTLDDIVDAAAEVVKLAGVEGLTMRRLAEELGVTPMAPYHYVKSKDELIEALGVRVLKEAFAAEYTGTRMSWEKQLRVQAHATFRALTAYPGLAAFLLDRPVVRAMRDSTGNIVELLERAGLSPEQARLAQSTYHTYMFGLVGMEARFRPLKRGKVDRAHDAILIDIDVDEFIDFGIDLLIDGIRARLKPST